MMMIEECCSNVVWDRFRLDRSEYLITYYSTTEIQ